MSASIENQEHSGSAFMQRCKLMHRIVEDYLNDKLNLDSIRHAKKYYIFDLERHKKVKDKVIRTMDVMKGAIEKHSLAELAVSYNGGKDCLVMLVLLMSVIYSTYGQKTESNSAGLAQSYKLDCVYVNSEKPFPQLTEFIEKSTSYYCLRHVTIESSLKDGFEKYLKNTNVKAIIIGIRHSDPYGSSLHYEQMTDHHWPKFLRIHPMLHWDYVDIWDFLLCCNIEYCEMYDEGYTSLGGVNNTIPNPYLKMSDQNKYYPAYALVNDADKLERCGRIK